MCSKYSCGTCTYCFNIIFCQRLPWNMTLQWDSPAHDGSRSSWFSARICRLLFCTYPETSCSQLTWGQALWVMLLSPESAGRGSFHVTRLHQDKVFDSQTRLCLDVAASMFTPRPGYNNSCFPASENKHSGVQKLEDESVCVLNFVVVIRKSCN